MKTFQTLLTTVVAGGIGVLGAAYVGVAGPLDPPAGPPAPTYKTLAEAEPRIPVGPTTTPGGSFSLYRITQPGSYYLTGNITGEAGKAGIQILTGDVTLDLNGFAVVGVAGSTSGIEVAGSPSNITVRNGVVRDWDSAGIYAFGDTNLTFADLRLAGNGRDGLNAGARCTVVDCIAEGNGEEGFEIGEAAVVRGCVAAENAGAGILTGMTAVVEGCVARNNGGIGISVGQASAVAGCVARLNDSAGISTNAYTTITGCTAVSNTATGITAVAGCHVSGCTVAGNGVGVESSSDTTIERCEIRNNSGGGIRVGSRSNVRENLCQSNGVAAGEAGIHAQGEGNRIEGNNLNGNGVGVRTGENRNVIVRNTFYLNSSHMDLAAGQTAATSSDPATAGPWHNIYH